MTIDGLSYRQWQKRNTEMFQKLSRDQQRTARDQGYYNISWQRVQQSWCILQSLNNLPPVLNLFDAKLNQGDLAGAIHQYLLAAEQAQKVAQTSRNKLRQQRQQMKELAKTALTEYQLL